MVQFQQPLNTQERDPIGDKSFEPLPVGWYPLAITGETDLKEVKSGKGKGYQLTLAVVNGPYKGKELKEWFCYIHEDKWIQARSENKIRRLAQVCGKNRLADTREIHQVTFYAYIGQKAGKYTTENGEVKDVVNNSIAPSEEFDEQILSVAEYKARYSTPANTNNGASNFVNSQATTEPDDIPF